MKLFDYVDEALFNKMLNTGNIMMHKHEIFDLYIIKYTKICNAMKIWNDATEKCRGIIVDNDYNIVARSFPKFYNYEEYDDTSLIPTNLSFNVYEKLDGSLGILYWYNDVPYIATAGSFNSDQAIHATELLHTKYRNIWNKFYN